MTAKKQNRCAVNPLLSHPEWVRATDGHLRPRRIANDSEASAASYRRIRVVPMVRRIQRRYGNPVMGANRVALMFVMNGL